MKARLEKHLTETQTLRQWVSVSRCNLKTNYAYKFVTIFCRDVKVFLCHDFIAFVANTKKILSDSKVAVMCDFSENYSFVLGQAIVYPFIMYSFF